MLRLMQVQGFFSEIHCVYLAYQIQFYFGYLHILTCHYVPLSSSEFHEQISELFYIPPDP